jgi:hypothetical protein
MLSWRDRRRPHRQPTTRDCNDVFQPPENITVLNNVKIYEARHTPAYFDATVCETRTDMLCQYQSWYFHVYDSGQETWLTPMEMQLCRKLNGLIRDATTTVNMLFAGQMVRMEHITDTNTWATNNLLTKSANYLQNTCTNTTNYYVHIVQMNTIDGRYVFDGPVQLGH